MHTYLEKLLNTHYTLIGTIDEISHIKTGVENTNFLVRTSLKNYILRIYNSKHSIRGIRTDGQVRLEHDFIMKSSDESVPVAKPFKSIHGNTYFKNLVDGDFRFISLFEFAKGQSPDKFDAAIASELGVNVNKLMKAGSKFNNPNDMPIGHDIVSRAEKLTKQHADDFANVISKRYLKKSTTNNFGKLRMGLVHGDVKLENVLFKNGTLSAIIDFDDYRYSYLIEEIVMTLMHNIDSQEKNLIRSGHWIEFLKEINWVGIKSDFKYLNDLIRYRYVYDCVKIHIKKNDKLLNQVQADKEIQKILSFDFTSIK